MTEVFFLRHGQSLGNMTNHFLGHTNLDLSPLGYKQAELAKDFFKNINIDTIYSSDLIRAYNTVKPTADMKDLPIKTNENLREIFAGDWENQNVDDLWKNYPDSFLNWRTDIGNVTCPNGESVANLQKRFVGEVKKIVSENKDKRILIATHATPIRTMLCEAKGIEITDAKNIPWVSNASVTSILFEDDGSYFIRAEGFDAHLGDFKSTLSSKM